MSLCSAVLNVVIKKEKAINNEAKKASKRRKKKKRRERTRERKRKDNLKEKKEKVQKEKTLFVGGLLQLVCYHKCGLIGPWGPCSRRGD